MFTEMMAGGSGGGGGSSFPMVNVHHDQVNATTVYLDITDYNNPSNIILSTSFTATDYGGAFDYTTNFSFGGISYTLRVYSSTYERKTIPCVITANGFTLRGEIPTVPDITLDFVYTTDVFIKVVDNGIKLIRNIVIASS